MQTFPPHLHWKPHSLTTRQNRDSLSQIVMHLAPEWRAVIFSQLDTLLDLNNWQNDLAFIQKSTFMTFLRFIVFAAPTRLPSLGVGSTGHILAAWNNGDQHIAVEFLPADKAAASFVKQGARSKEALTWRGHVADLKLFIEDNGMSGFFETIPHNAKSARTTPSSRCAKLRSCRAILNPQRVIRDPKTQAITGLFPQAFELRPKIKETYLSTHWMEFFAAVVDAQFKKFLQHFARSIAM